MKKNLKEQLTENLKASINLLLDYDQVDDTLKEKLKERGKFDHNFESGGTVTEEQMLKMNQELGFQDLKGTPIQSEFTKGYNSFSGVDVKVIFEDEKGKEKISTMQGFSYKKVVCNGIVDLHGSANFICFDQPDNWLGKQVRMLAVAMNEYGALSVIFDEKVYFDTVGYGISVDDIISEQSYTFRGAVHDETIEDHNKRLETQHDRYCEEFKRESAEIMESLNGK